MYILVRASGDGASPAPILINTNYCPAPILHKELYYAGELGSLPG